MDSAGLPSPRRKFLAGLGLTGTALFAGLGSSPALAATSADSAPAGVSAQALADVSALAETVRSFVPLSFFTNPTPSRQNITEALTAHPQLTAQASGAAVGSLSGSGEVRFAALSYDERLTRLAERTAPGARLYTANATTQATLVTLHAQGIHYPELADSTASIFLGAVRIFVSRQASGARR